MTNPERLRLLLVEDDVVDRMAFERLVEQEALPYDLVPAGSVAEARTLLAAKNSGFDLILTDYELGDGTALDLLELGAETPMVLVTGAGDEETAARAMRAGVYDYLVKDLERRYLKLLPLTLEKAHRHHRSRADLRMLSQALTCLNDCVYITDLEGRFLFVNSTFCTTYGYTENEVLGHEADLLWAEDADQELEPLHPPEPPARGERGECRHLRQNGSRLTVELARSPIFDEKGQPMAVVGVIRDVTDQKCWERVLSESEQRYALAAAGANDGLWDWDLVRDTMYYSPRWKEIVGLASEELSSSPDHWLARVHDEDAELLRAQLDAHLEAKTPHFENEHRLRTQGGGYCWVQVRGLAVRDPVTGEARRIAGSLRDVDDSKKAEEELLHAAVYDALTGLPNRALFLDRLGNAIVHVKRRDGYLFGVIFLDLDRFKVINDSLGHLAGDQVLRAIARRLETCLRLGDTVARLGGDEFAVLVDDVADVSEVHRVAQRIHTELEAPFEVQGREFFTTASLGIAMSSDDYERPEEILRDADTAMFRAKAMGRKDLVVFHKEMHNDALKLLHLETDLRRAVGRREFRLAFQPIVRLRQGILTGFEALIRWQHPERGLLGPDEFLKTAHETGLMPSIGWWVLGEACRQLKAWQDRYPELSDVAVSVNLDGQQLSSFELVDRVDEALERSGLAPESLKLEITESMIIENPTITKKVLAKLRERQIGLHIDDFGTGYSSLGQLRRFPIDALKIDRSFISRMSIDDDDLELVRTILVLAKNLGLEVIAEGVETGEQLVQLRTLSCECAQGFMFAQPMAPEQVEEKLASGNWPLLHGATVRPVDSGEPSGVIERLSLNQILEQG